MANLFILLLGLESLIGRLNQQSFQVMRNFFILYLINSHPEAQEFLLDKSGGFFSGKYKKFLRQL